MIANLIVESLNTNTTVKWFEKSEKCVELLLFGLFEIQFQSTRQIFNLEETNFQFHIYHVAPEANFHFVSEGAATHHQDIVNSGQQQCRANSNNAQFEFS